MFNPIKFTNAPPGDYFNVRIKSVTVRRDIATRMPTEIHHVTEKFAAKQWISPTRIKYERVGQYA